MTYDRKNPSPFALEDAARALAANHNLIDEESYLHCWECGIVCNWHVSLHCDPCRFASLERTAQRRAREALERAEMARYQSLGRCIERNPRLSRDNAERMIREWSQRPAATAERKADLERKLSLRFDKPAPSRWSSKVDPGFRRSGDD